MNYSEQIRHPSGALDPPQEEKRGGWGWLWLVSAAVIVVLIIAVFRPAWLAKIGVHVSLPSAAKAVGAVANPMRWV